MTKTIWTATFTAMVGAATIAALAQTPAPQQNSSASPENQVTVTGCLQPAPSNPTDTAGASGTAGTTGSTAGTAGTATAGSSTNQQFVLTNATMTTAAAEQSAAGSAGSTAGSTTGSTGTAGEAGTSAEASPSGQTYRLLVNPTSLIPHVGKKLELTGTLVNGPGSASSASSQAGEASNAPMLRVTKGKVIAESCQ